MNEHSKGNAPGGAIGRRWLKRIFWGLLVGAVTVGVIISAMPKPAQVELSEVTQGPFLVTVNEDGVSRIRDRYVVSAPLPGTLARLSLNPGDEVAQGQVLAHILPLSAPLLDSRSRSEAEARVSAAQAGLRQANAQIERAQVTLQFAEKEAKTTRQLAKKGTLSQLDLERAELQERSSRAELSSAQFAAKVATHELEMARAALRRFERKAPEREEQFEVTSPSTGRVLRVIQQSEGVVQPGEPLLEIGDPKALEVAVDVLTSDAVEIEPGAHVTLSHWGGPELAAVVRLVEPAAFSRVSSLGVEEQRVNTIVDLTSPYDEWRRLGDGYRVEARIEVYENDAAIQIPWSCLFHDEGLSRGDGLSRDEGRWAVFVAKEGVARQVPVEVGRRNDTHAEILGGLSAGARVLRHPSDRIRDGAAISD